MSCATSEKPEQERRSLQTSLPELRQPLAYVHHLRSHWKPEGRAKLIVPTSWMEFLALADGKCGIECVVNRCCPFRHVRFESDAETRLPGEELPRDIVSQLLPTNVGMDDHLATCVPRAFEGIPGTRPRSDMPATYHFPRSTSQCIDFALVSEHGSDDTENVSSESNTRYLLLGMKEPAQTQHPHSTSLDSRSRPRTSASLPEELTNQGQLHLRRLASLIQRQGVGATTESFPEWLVLFGLVCDVHHVRVVAYVPHRRTLDVIECAAYIVDELPFRSVIGTPTCELAFERLRLLLALTTLRRHVHHLSKSLFTTMGSRDGIRRTGDHPSFLGCSAHDQHNSDDSESLNQCASLGSSRHCSSEYSTCPSSVHARELNDVPLPERKELSSCRSFTSSFCSTCSGFSESASASDSLYSGNSKCTNSDYMEPSTISLSQGGNKSVPCPHKLTETKRWEIITWAREVEHPVKDTYRMVIYHPRPRQQKGADSISGARRWRL